MREGEFDVLPGVFVDHGVGVGGLGKGDDGRDDGVGGETLRHEKPQTALDDAAVGPAGMIERRLAAGARGDDLRAVHVELVAEAKRG